ncbi:hypothetical protein D3C79_746510 [compost metagenome]
MALQTHQHIGATGPAADHPCQRGQQQVIDLRTIGCRCFLQELSREFPVQTDTDRRRVALQVTAVRIITGQLITRPLQLRLPVAQF